MGVNKRNLTFSANENPALEKVIKENSSRVAIPKNKIFIYQGEKLNYLYFIKEGKTRHYMADPNGAEKILYVLTKGWFFGEASLVLDYNETTLYSQAETDTVLCLIEWKKAKDLLDNNKTFREGVLKSFAFKTMILRHELENVLFTPAKDRIKTFLCLNINHEKPDKEEWLDIATEYTHYEIGVLVGCTRVTVTKIMQELMKEGFIRVINNKMQINREKYFEFINQG